MHHASKSASQLPQAGKYWCHKHLTFCGRFVAVATVVADLWQLFRKFVADLWQIIFLIIYDRRVRKNVSIYKNIR